MGHIDSVRSDLALSLGNIDGSSDSGALRSTIHPLRADVSIEDFYTNRHNLL